MHLGLWNTIVSATDQVRSLMDRSLPSNAASPTAATIVVTVDESQLGTLRNQLKQRFADLETQLASELAESEVYQVLLPLVIHCDEQVLRRLPVRHQPKWPLLQRERFQIDDGGDVFYHHIEERLGKLDTTALVFEVLYYCLSDGFLGRFASDPNRIAAYKARLAAKIPMADLAAKRRRRLGEGSGREHSRHGELGAGAGDGSSGRHAAGGQDGKRGRRRVAALPGLPPPPFSRPAPLALYAAALVLAALVPFVIVLISNL